MDAKLNQFEVTAEELDQYPGQELNSPLPVQIDRRNLTRIWLDDSGELYDAANPPMPDDDATGVK